MEDNVIQFPIENKRLDVSTTPTDPEEIMEEIQYMKKAFFSEVADRILDDVLRSINVLSLHDSKYETFDMTPTDHIMIKESIMASLCRIAGMDHPLHGIGTKEIIQQDDFEGEDSVFHSYKFRSEDDKASEAN